MLNTAHLSKNYGSLTALDQLTLEIPEGRIGLLGPNGAGKSTFLKLVLGLLQPTNGEAEVLGHRVGPESLKLRRLLGYMPEHDCLPGEVPGVEFVAQMGRLSGMVKGEALQRAHEVLHYLQMGDERYRPISEYSGGMRQKVKLAQALVHSPRLLLADEPTSGLDPIGREEMLGMLRELSQEGELNIILSTHLLQDVEHLCDRVVIINEGRLLIHSQVKDILDRQSGMVALHTDAPDRMREGLQKRGFQIQGHGEELQVLGDTDKVMIAAVGLAAELGVGIRHLKQGTHRLEDLYLETVAKKTGGDNG